MTDTTLAVKDGAGASKSLRVQDQGGAGLLPYHMEDDTQRAALLAALGTLGAQTTLAAILAKLIAAPATEATQATGNTKLDTLHTDLGAVETLLAGTLAVSGPLTNAQLGAAALSTAAGQVTGNGKLDTLHTDLVAVEALLAGTLAVSGPLTAAQLTTAALATHTDMTALTAAVKAAAGAPTNLLGYQQLTTAMSSAQPLTVPGGATFAVVQAEAVDVRWRDDATNPTASIGMLLQPGDAPRIFSGATQLAALRFIQTAAGSILNVSYYS